VPARLTQKPRSSPPSAAETTPRAAGGRLPSEPEDSRARACAPRPGAPTNAGPINSAHNAKQGADSHAHESHSPQPHHRQTPPWRVYCSHRKADGWSTNGLVVAMGPIIAARASRGNGCYPILDPQSLGGSMIWDVNPEEPVVHRDTYNVAVPGSSEGSVSADPG
jgi:hypothetical protein